MSSTLASSTKHTSDRTLSADSTTSATVARSAATATRTNHKHHSYHSDYDSDSSRTLRQVESVKLGWARSCRARSGRARLARLCQVQPGLAKKLDKCEYEHSHWYPFSSCSGQGGPSLGRPGPVGKARSGWEGQVLSARPGPVGKGKVRPVQLRSGHAGYPFET